MRNLILLTLGALLALSPCASAQRPASNVSTLYKQGLQAIKVGEAAVAQAKFEQVLRLQPNHPNAKFQLRQLKLGGGLLGAKKRELQLQKVKVPAVDFDQLTLREALGALNEMVLQQTEKKFAPNFVIRDPDGIFDTRRFSLKLGSLPASVVLKYCVENVGAKVRYDEHAILVSPVGTVKKKAAEPAAPKSQPKK